METTIEAPFPAQIGAFLAFAGLVTTNGLLILNRPPLRVVLPLALLFPVGMLLAARWRVESSVPFPRFLVGLVLAGIGMAGCLRAAKMLKGS